MARSTSNSNKISKTQPPLSVSAAPAPHRGDGGSADNADAQRKSKVKETRHPVAVETKGSSSSSSTTKRKSIVPSASSIILELLEQTAKQKIAESQIIMSSAPTAPHDNHNCSTSANPSAIGNNTNSEMSMNNTVGATSTEGSDGNPNNAQTASSAPAPSASVVPQLMDIYDDLAQSSTPQTVTTVPMPALPQIPMPAKGVGYYSHNNSGSYESTGSLVSQNSERSSSRRRSGSRSQCTVGIVAPGTHYAAAMSERSRRSTAKKVKANEMMEEYNNPSRSTASRKKGKISSADQRWSKRFTWPDELHRDFVAAIFDVGLKHASPSAIMEFMRPKNNPDVTSERVKSHLQKYRLNRQKSRTEFMTSYDCALDGFQKRQQQGDLEDSEEGTGGSFSCGEAAALCTHASLTEDRRGSGDIIGGTSSREESRRSTPVPGTMAPISSASQVSTEGGDVSVGTLQMPLLTTHEKDGPIGQAFGYLVGMYQALTQQLEDGRQQQQGIVGSSSDRAVPSSTPLVCSPQSQAAVAHHQHDEPHQQQQHVSQYPQPQQQVVYHHHQTIQPTVEQAAATAASMHHANDPSIHEVAASIPHHLMGPQQSVAATQSPHYAAGQPQQQHHHAQPPQQHQQYPQGQAHTSISNGQQHSSSHYAGNAPAPQGEYHTPQVQVHPPPPRQIMQQPQYAYGAPAPHPSYTVVASAPSNNHVVGHNQPPPQQQAQKYLPPHQPNHNHPTYPAAHHTEIPTIDHHGSHQQPPQQAFAPRNNPPPPRTANTHHQPSAGPPRQQQAPAPAMHHPSAPQSVPLPASALPPPHAYVSSKVSQESYPSQPQQHHHATSSHQQQAPAPPPAASSHHYPKDSSAAPSAASQPNPNISTGDTTTVNNNPLAGTGRTLQAQKESSMMKQEMQGQMVFQNKIRALKQIELSKYDPNMQESDNGGGANARSSSVPPPADAHHSSSHHHHEEQQQQSPEHTDMSPLGHQLSEEPDQEFWNPEDDDQIFDFLLDH